MARICVFCASSERIDPVHVELGYAVGAEIARRGHDLVWGGASVSTMGSVARGVRDGGRHTLGVIPEVMLPLEVADADADELVVTVDMRERKGRMDASADGFLTLPGGLGTLEELLELYTWAQLGLHQKPCALLDVEGYYGRLAEFLEHAVEERFLREEHRAMLIVERDPRALIERLRRFEPGAVQPKWIGREET